MRSSRVPPFFIILSALFLFSCQPRNGSVVSTREISINPENSIDLDLGKTLLEARYVPLETIPESSVMFPDKVIAAFGNLYVLDRRQKALLLFDSDGNFKKKLRTIPTPGPQEIAEIYDISYNPFDKTISAVGVFYVAKYSAELEFIEKVQQKVGMWHHSWISEDEFIYYSNYLNPQNKTLIGQFNFSDQEEDAGLILQDENPGIRFMQPGVFSRSENGILICPPLNDTVYKYSEGELSIHRTFDYGEFQMPKKARTKLTTRSFRELKYQAYAFHIINYRENKHNIMFSYNYMNKHRKFIYFLDNDIGYSIRDIYVDEDKFYLRSVGTSGSGGLITWYSPEEFKKLEEANLVSPKMSVTANSNPILCFIDEIILSEKE